MTKTKRSKSFAIVISFIMLFTYAIFWVGESSIIVNAFNPVLIENQGSITGNCTSLNTVYKYNYYKYTAVQLIYKYTSFDSDGKYDDDKTGQVKDINYNDTFEFVVFDSDCNGWDKTTVGPNTTPVLGKNYTAVIPISNIENKLSTGKAPYGINLQTGGNWRNKNNYCFI